MYDPATRHIRLGAVEGRRFKLLGNIGEAIALDLLGKHRFKNIINLNEMQNNFPFADFAAERDGAGYLISVKARNKYQVDGKLNASYKLGKKVYEHIKILQGMLDYKEHVPAWLAIALEEKTYDAYFGTIEQLKGNRFISMGERVRGIFENLALACPHTYDPQMFVNKYEPK